LSIIVEKQPDKFKRDLDVMALSEVVYAPITGIEGDSQRCSPDFGHTSSSGSVLAKATMVMSARVLLSRVVKSGEG